MSKTLARRLAYASAIGCLLVGAVGAHEYHLGGLRLGHPWTRPTPPSAPTAVGYLTITNTGSAPERLLDGTSPDVDRIEVHEMSLTGGVMRMRPVAGGLEIPPGRTVALAPGGFHLMLIGPRRPFKLGDRIPATLRFEHAGAVRVEFVTQSAPPETADHRGEKQ